MLLSKEVIINNQTRYVVVNECGDIIEDFQGFGATTKEKACAWISQKVNRGLKSIQKQYRRSSRTAIVFHGYNTCKG